MAKFKIKIKKHSFLELTIDAEDKLSACLIAKQKARKREGWSREVYDVVEIKTE